MTASTRTTTQAAHRHDAPQGRPASRLRFTAVAEGLDPHIVHTAAHRPPQSVPTLRLAVVALRGVPSGAATEIVTEVAMPERPRERLRKSVHRRPVVAEPPQRPSSASSPAPLRRTPSNRRPRIRALAGQLPYRLQVPASPARSASPPSPQHESSTPSCRTPPERSCRQTSVIQLEGHCYSPRPRDAPPASRVSKKRPVGMISRQGRGGQMRFTQKTAQTGNIPANMNRTRFRGS